MSYNKQRQVTLREFLDNYNKVELERKLVFQKRATSLHAKLSLQTVHKSKMGMNSIGILLGKARLRVKILKLNYIYGFHISNYIKFL